MITLTKTQTPAGLSVRASMSFDGGTLSAVKTGDKPARVVFSSQWGEVSYPMLTKHNKTQWVELVTTVNLA